MRVYTLFPSFFQVTFLPEHPATLLKEMKENLMQFSHDGSLRKEKN